MNHDFATMMTATNPAAAEAAPAYAVANAEGVFETFERLVLPGLPVKCTGEFYFAQAGPEEWFAGWYLHLRQPLNTTKELPGKIEAHASRAAALGWLIDHVAGPFFSEHKAASKRLAVWRAEVLGGVEGGKELTRESGNVETEEVPAGELPGAEEPVAGGPVEAGFGVIAVADIEANPHNPRAAVSADYIAELAASIAAQGFLLQPIAVRDQGEAARPRYRLIAGFCRWLAHKKLGWTSIEAKIFTGVNEARAGELALVENLQRRELNPMEEAWGFVELRDRYGYDVQKIHERTGKEVRVIQYAFQVAALPAEVAARGREGVLSMSVLRLLAAKRWAERPAHCRALAEWIVRGELPVAVVREGLGEVLAPEAAAALAAAKLAVEVSGYLKIGDVVPGGEVVADTAGGLWHLAPGQWKAERAEIDRLQAVAERAAADKAAARAKTAIAARVNVRCEDLAVAHLDYVSLAGELARYTAHLPAETVAEGLDAAGKEIVVCLRPVALKALRVREAELLAADVAAKLPALLERALAVLVRLRRIGAREVAFVVDANLRGVAAVAGVPLDGRAFTALGLMPPEAGLARENLATCEPLDLLRAVVVSVLLNTKGGELYSALRWVLQIEDLGLAEESEERREQIVAAAASEVFPVVEMDPRKLAEWERANALGMPVAEIARSYGVKETDVRGALGLGNTAGLPTRDERAANPSK
ncbi:MAG: hypothetical protein RLZZ15_168 [Verrucomicrobiota bacterium]|jgi:ParB/RepB/Spo0J family partition protein